MMSSVRLRAMLATFLALGSLLATFGGSSAAVTGTSLLPWVPNGDNSGGMGPWFGQVIVQNTSDFLCSVTISVGIGSESITWEQTEQLILNPNSSIEFTPAELQIPSGPPFGAPVLVNSSGCKAATAMKQASGSYADPPWSHGARAIAGYTGIPGEDMEHKPAWFLPIVQTNNSWNTLIRVTNAEPFSAKSVTVDLFPSKNQDGEAGREYTTTFTLRAGQSTAIDVLAAIDKTEWIGFARVTSVGNVAAMVQREKPSADLAMVNIGNAQPTDLVTTQALVTHTLYAPIIFNAYNGWATGINIANTTGAVAHVTVAYPGANRPNDQVALAPFSSDYVYTPANAPQQTGFVGHAVITSDQPVSAVVDEVKYSTLDAISYTASSFRAPQVSVPLVFKHSQNGDRYDDSGINVQNTSNSPITVEIRVFRPNGASAGGPYTLDVPANGSNFIYLASTNASYDLSGNAAIRATNGQAGIVVVSNDVSYDVGGDGSAVFSAPTPDGLYRIGLSGAAIP